MEVTNRINKYLERIFAEGRTEVNSADLPLENDDDYVDSMFLLSRYKETSSYEIEFSEGSVNHGKYSIPSFVIRKKIAKYKKIELELSLDEFTELTHAVHSQIKNYEKLVDDINEYNKKYDVSYGIKEIAQYKGYISMLNSIYERLHHS